VCPSRGVRGAGFERGARDETPVERTIVVIDLGGDGRVRSIRSRKSNCIVDIVNGDNSEFHDFLPILKGIIQRCYFDHRRIFTARYRKRSLILDGIEGHCIVVRLYSVLDRSEEHTSELQSRENLVCRLLLEKKNKNERQKT